MKRIETKGLTHTLKKTKLDHRHKYKMLNYNPFARKHRKKIYIT